MMGGIYFLSFNSFLMNKISQHYLFAWVTFTLIVFAGKFGYSQTTLLHKDWMFRRVGTELWKEATVPGTIHTDLLRHSLIQDPFYGDNETKIQWVSKADWEYKTFFQVDLKKRAQGIFIRFHGLDTYADVMLNGIIILHSDNMFRTYYVDISLFVKYENELSIVFHSAELKADSIANLYLPLVRPCENNRHYIRKAQYHFGWDWAPRILTTGIWRDVELVYGDLPQPGNSQYSSVRFVQESDSIGRSFYFTEDGKPLYMKGANWVPADVFLPRVNKNKYRNLLLAAKEAKLNMLRVWGGGIYEDDAFYDLCDSLGIYVWQDFMFAGAMYPADSFFIENVRAEVKDIILRLRKHKCIVLWCGNNEINEAWNNWGWQSQFHISLEDSVRLWNEYDRLFNQVIPDLVKELDSGRSYIPSSPLFGWGREKSMSEGDSHYWGLWWGHYSLDSIRLKIPLFMSEFGMQAMPSMESILKFAAKSDLDTSSMVMKLHQKHSTGFATLADYLRMEKIAVTNFQTFVLGTQELQKRCLKAGYEAQMNSKGRCMGSLWWQFNDCWPVCSWSLIDYYGVKKKAYYSLKDIEIKKDASSMKPSEKKLE